VPLPYDATTKDLFDRDPRAWAELLLGRKIDVPTQILNVDLSTVTSAADALIEVKSPHPWIVHVEFQTGYEKTIPLRLQRYNILVHYAKGLPVQSIALLLRPRADGPALSGHLQQWLPDGTLYHEFRYNVVRAWELPVEAVLAGGLATLPLAPIAKVTPAEVPALFRTMKERIDVGVKRDDALVLWTATYLLAGLVHPEEVTMSLFQLVPGLKESSTYQAILREGREEGLEKGRAEGKLTEAIKMLIKFGTRQFGPPDPSALERLQSITDLEQIEALSDRMFEVASWDELLAGE
jgi:predicted transposase YdaD